MRAPWQPPPPLPPDPSHPRIQAALAELEGLIRQRFPDASFRVTQRQEDPAGVFLTAIVDTDDLDAVTAAAMERAVDLQVEEGVPVYVVAEWPAARIRAYWQQRAARPMAEVPELTLL